MEERETWMEWFVKKLEMATDKQRRLIQMFIDGIIQAP